MTTELLLFFLLSAVTVESLGGGTLAVVYGSGAVCGIVAGNGTQAIQCWRNGHVSTVSPPGAVSVAAGRDWVCGVRSGGFSLLCFDSNHGFAPKRIYFDYDSPLQDLTIGDDQICALTNGTQNLKCWRNSGELPNVSEPFRSISSGIGFSCGVLMNSNKIRCWGNNSEKADFIQKQFEDETMFNIVVGGNHACGLNLTGILICKGENNMGQLQVPSYSPFLYSKLALGETHTCATLRSNGSVICWGGNDSYSSKITEGVSFETIVAGLNFTCGLTTNNFSIICWGPGWPYSFSQISLPKILPGPCVQSTCSDCGIYPESQTLCSGSGNICKSCDIPILSPPPINYHTQLSRSKGLTGGLLALTIVGSIGAFSGFCTVIYCLWAGVCFGKKKIHNSVQPTINNNNNNNGSNSNGHQVFASSPPSRCSTIRRQGSRLMRRQRSGTSSKTNEKSEEFLFSDLVAATNNFSLDNKIGAGSYGIVYRGKLWDGREVAIKRGETETKTKKFQEKESAFESELSFLSRLHHKHLVRLIGFCEEGEERLLVYEYMKNRALYDHLHDKNNVEKTSSVINSWKMRIKVSLDAARGIEYLHNYAVPPIIHRDIKSSNILLDANWTAKVSDFGLSLLGPTPESDFRPLKAAGTVGYIDPEYYGLNVLTAKSDVYGLGVVLLELLTGKRAIFKGGEENGGQVESVVDFAVREILEGESRRVLDERVGMPENEREAEAVELVGYTAVCCVSLEAKDRPSMSDVVVNLERALALCDYNHGTISSGEISIVT